jgi:hypothetical protein
MWLLKDKMSGFFTIGMFHDFIMLSFSHLKLKGRSGAACQRI